MDKTTIPWGPDPGQPGTRTLDLYALLLDPRLAAAVAAGEATPELGVAIDVALTIAGRLPEAWVEAVRGLDHGTVDAFVGAVNEVRVGAGMEPLSVPAGEVGRELLAVAVAGWLQDAEQAAVWGSKPRENALPVVTAVLGEAVNMAYKLVRAGDDAAPDAEWTQRIRAATVVAQIHLSTALDLSSVEEMLRRGRLVEPADDGDELEAVDGEATDLPVVPHPRFPDVEGIDMHALLLRGWRVPRTRRLRKALAAARRLADVLPLDHLEEEIRDDGLQRVQAYVQRLNEGRASTKVLALRPIEGVDEADPRLVALTVALEAERTRRIGEPGEMLLHTVLVDVVSAALESVTGPTVLDFAAASVTLEDLNDGLRSISASILDDIGLREEDEDDVYRDA